VSLASVPAPFEWRTDGGLSRLHAKLDGAVAAFSTRLGGVSEAAFASLNLGILTDDDPARVRRNRELLAEVVGRPLETILMGRQVHGTGVEARDEADGALREADAQLTHSTGLTPLVLVADCVPVVVARPGAVAAVHCGWRGVAGGILERALDALGRGGVSAVLGPGIGACCYEVGEEVRAAFRARGHEVAAMPDGRLDLPQAIRTELERLGVPRVSDCGLCTSCNADLFFSHRRDRGATGRQAGLAWLAS
jgi:polyphenol oxidase